MNTYTLSYNPFETKFSATLLLNFIRENRKVLQYYQPFMGTYIIKSDETLLTLVESFGGQFDGAPFLLSYTSPSLVGGAQEPVIWQWINSGALPALTNPTR